MTHDAETGKQVARMFFSAPTSSKPQTLCLVCGHQCRAALRIHPNCVAKVGFDEAEDLREAYFQNYTRRER